jgi:hypothetical protein
MMRALHYRTVVIVVFLGCSPLLFGCRRGTSLDRLPEHGTVTLASGEKLTGSITFLPEKGQSGPSATAKLAEGSYRFDRNDGPTAGPKTVIVRRIVPRRAAVESISKKQPAQQTKSEWTVSAELADDGTYLHDFDLGE